MTSRRLALGVTIASIAMVSVLAYGAVQGQSHDAWAGEQPWVDPGCESFRAWTRQVNPRSDVLGTNNFAYPEANATYWSTLLTGAIGDTVTLRGRYPLARYMSFQVYDDQRHVLDAIADAALNPDPGQNNPYRTGTAQGTYTAQLVFGEKPTENVPANTIYTDGLTTVALVYRIYYSNNPDNLPATVMDPILPEMSVGEETFETCPPRPIVLPEDALVWGRLDNGDFVGTKPSIPLFPTNPPRWVVVDTSGSTSYYPSEDNSYMAALVSRDFLRTPHNYEMVVVRLKPPTFPNTQAGVPPYSPAQVRFWSMCQNEPLLTSVTRCLPDNAHILKNGYATYVFSDPSKRPADDVLSRWGARWIPWGALQPGDEVYDIGGDALDNDDGVFYYGNVLYRQTMADPAFRQSIQNVSRLPIAMQRAAMGTYWPAIGYCTRATFDASGPGCIGQ